MARKFPWHELADHVEVTVGNIGYVPGEFEDPAGPMRWGFVPLRGWPNAPVLGQGHPCGALMVTEPVPVNQLYALPNAPILGQGHPNSSYIEQMPLDDQNAQYAGTDDVGAQ